jgi:anti-sigma factor RsiW
MRPLMRHPQAEEMLKYADGELPGRDAGELRAHLEACWECRAAIEELQNTVSQCVSYRKNVLQKHLPPPPAPWTDIYQRFSEIDAAVAQPSFLDRIVQALRWPMHNSKKWVPVAVALMIVWGLYSRFHTTPSVQAAELLRKAVVAAETRVEKPRRLQIRTRDRRLTRLAGSDRKVAATSADADALNSVQALFVAANYDWNNPLSPKSYEAWRSQLREKQDQVTENREFYQVRTESGSGELVEATLKLRTQDLRPVEGRFEFRNREWVEITELADDGVPPSEIAAAPSHAVNGQAHATPEITPDSAAASPASAFATAGDELRAVAALHQVGADLGDPVEVSRNGSEVVVSGVGVDPVRQREIQNALNAQPHVVVRFNESASSNMRPARSSADTALSADVQQLQSRIAAQVGGRANFEQLASQVLDLSEPMMSRAYALRRLAELFPAEVESQLSAQDRQLLRHLQQEHTAALRQQSAELSRMLKPVLPSGSSSPGKVISSGAWQPATEDLFQTARRVEKLLAVMFAAAPGESADDQVPAQLLSSLAELRAKLEGYDRLSANTER